MSMPDWLIEFTAWAGGHRWMVWVFLILFATAALDLVQRIVLRSLARRARGTSNLWDDAVLWSLVGPVGLIIWVLGITIAAEAIGRYADTDAALFDYVGAIRKSGVIVALGWFALRLTRAVESRLIERVRAVSFEPDEGPDRSTVQAIGKLLRATVLIGVGLVLLQTLGFSISGVLAFGGIGGIAIGFAARDMLANFFGGIMLHLDRPMAVGEWVRSPDREIEGTVEHISWRITRLRTFDQRPLYVPNSIFSNIIVENPSRMTHRRIYETVGVRYDDIAVVSAIANDIRAMLDEHEQIDSDATLIVNFTQYSESSLDFMIYCLTRETRWAPYHAIKEEVMLRIGDIIRSHGAEIAYPTSTLHVATMPQPGGEPANADDKANAASWQRGAQPSRGRGRHGQADQEAEGEGGE
ncbi:mechanosensitive ion channel family protein [Halofilum ochraceum]|uniref:mechanosensitive ion channel family protein n=1 Tax=Halofilum ochraceum TaxID=1611323 RepID=UPI0008DACC26|nr:mechanosensitive ion channel family protein [Halofilum ochraceum]